ncbi:hypothetical protein [Puia dinghuensis]|uniref:Uncharacterized protein n=1 Tax=Puia dinghuensis TaxID=1792502 RepID=A0A8J2XR38_9BACT|nr:hypothetical protein [Puia dinghuensis]GGA98059.1 hypothetical protein GCM10011511_21710 [Puia dinghuensis]
MKNSVNSLLAMMVVLMGCTKKDVISSSSITASTTSSTTTYYYQSGSSVTQTGKTWYSTISDTAAVEVTGAGTYVLTYSDIWSSGATTSTDSSSFYGLNAAVLATAGSSITLNNDSITTSGKGGNGVFSYGTSTVSLNTDTILCTGANAHGIYAAGGATLTATNIIATTSGSSASVIATDRGGGTVTVSGGSYSASGGNSAAVYSTGSITCTGSTLTTTGAEAVVVEGANSVTLKNCTIKSTYNKWGALVYQSYSGDASGASGVLTITGGSFTYTGTAGGLFYNTNDSATIYLTGVTLTNSCDTLIRAMEGAWGAGTATSGGGTLLVTSGQTLSGMLYADASSGVTLDLTNSSAYTGKINPGNVARTAKVILDATSTWTLTGDTYLTALSDATASYSNISANGYKLYVAGTRIL